jgi:hypothetical protein
MKDPSFSKMSLCTYHYEARLVSARSGSRNLINLAMSGRRHPSPFIKTPAAGELAGAIL